MKVKEPCCCFEQSLKMMPILCTCERNIIALNSPGNSQFGFKHSISFNKWRYWGHKVAWGRSSIGWFHDHGNIMCYALRGHNEFNKGNECILLKREKKRCRVLVGAPRNLFCWKKSPHFLAVFESKLQIPWCVQYNIILRLPRSQKPPQLVGTVFWPCWDSFAGHF